MRLSSRFAALLACAWELGAPVQAQSAEPSNTTHLAFFPGLLQPETTSARAYCPSSCAASGPTSFSWSRILSIEELGRCDQTIIFEAMLRFPLDAPGRQLVLKACTSSATDAEPASSKYGPVALANADVVNATAHFQTGWSGPPASQLAVTQIAESALKLQHQIALDPNNRLTAIFAKSGKTVVGLYAGGQVHKSSVSSLMDAFIHRVNDAKQDVPSRLAMQVCGPTGERSAAHVFGMVADADGDLRSVHKAISGWADGECMEGFDGSSTVQNQTMVLIPAVPLTQDSTTNLPSNQTQTNNTSSLLAEPSIVMAGNECKYTMVESGDTCPGIASRCSISLAKLVEYNGGDQTAFCNNLMPKTAVCCSTGDKPDLKPKPQENGDCAVHEVQKDDGCWAIADKYHLTQEEIHKLNVGKTWGWAGCGQLLADQKICISDGRPPMPNQVQNVTCGPQVIGTERPDDGTDIKDLNPCPLKVCCSGWGYCGLTDEFCTDTSIDDTPGTHEPNTNGCISNCGKIEITNNDTPPENFIRVGYFEAWNGDRPCLNMDVTEVKDPITHIHFAFGHISNDFVPSTDATVTEQWVKFLAMTGPKKIISFGGWAFSNEPGTSHIMRQGVMPANRQKFADNIIKFVNDNKLDGVDFDWEYPGADDIEGSDPGTKEDGANYLKFLTLVRNGLPKEKSVAIAAPASYWYLRHFPIAAMSKILTYIVYMTYDLHGQWDAGSKWASTGCANGDCLRSHVNITETINSLAMITRAGVPSNKVIVGITSYGRSFKMADPNCWGPSCLYLGARNDSPAQPGKCTNTGGYIANGEIEEIIKSKAAPFKQIFDEASDSDILIYNNVEYVGYMSQETKDRRVARYKGLNFGGATDWAVDL
ncbi:glycoside hydrolase superfamily, partial [Microdochium trichocladiopsis]